MAKAVIFDVDGTLVDSVDLHAHAWVDAFRDYGQHVDFNQVRAQIGKGGDELMPVFLTEAELKEYGEELENHRRRILKERYLPNVKGFPNVRELFERLLQDGKKIVLASSAKEDELERYKKAAGIEDLVHAETSADDADRSKPHPDIFKEALKRLAVRAEEAVVIGDTPYDAEAATKAGIRTVGLLCGGWNEDDLRNAGCIEIYNDPAHLLTAYDRSSLVWD